MLIVTQEALNTLELVIIWFALAALGKLHPQASQATCRH